MTTREKCLLLLLGFIFPIYPSLGLMQESHGSISIIKIVLISLANSFLVFYFWKRALNLMAIVNNKMDDIRQYLDSRYSKENQQIIIKNYWRFTSRSKFFRDNNPLFSREAQLSDPMLRSYRNASFIAVAKLLGGGFLYLLSLAITIYLLAWKQW